MEKTILLLLIGFLYIMAFCFKSTIKELNEMFTDFIKFKRFKNQLNILKTTRQLLSQEGFSPDKVSIKILAPLIKKISFEKPKSKASSLICNNYYGQWKSDKINPWCDIKFIPLDGSDMVLIFIHGRFDKQ